MEAIAVLPSFLWYGGRAAAGRTGDPVAALIRAPEHPLGILRRDALSAHAETGDGRATSAVEVDLDDPSPSARDQASRLLGGG
jgi:hypothetical protein